MNPKVIAAVVLAFLVGVFAGMPGESEAERKARMQSEAAQNAFYMQFLMKHGWPKYD